MLGDILWPKLLQGTALIGLADKGQLGAIVFDVVLVVAQRRNAHRRQEVLIKDLLLPLAVPLHHAAHRRAHYNRVKARVVAHILVHALHCVPLLAQLSKKHRARLIGNAGWQFICKSVNAFGQIVSTALPLRLKLTEFIQHFGAA